MTYNLFTTENGVPPKLLLCRKYPARGNHVYIITALGQKQNKLFNIPLK